MSSLILKANGQIITSTMVQSLTKDDLALPNYIKLMEQHVWSPHNALDIKDSVVTPLADVDTSRLLHVPDDDLEEFEFCCDDIDEADKHDVDTYNQLIGAQIELNRGGETVKGRVKDRLCNDRGDLLGRSDPNPLLDTGKYIVEYYDGS
eukprot:CAMPEP_0196816250 /NCGR_PEP_ID=MMETSP1362-20130617/54312_1 /TAXON_ID=163516 /ORGANISM="Leptocylindrus danicus, Strain CCMP1856" /LENGTH=148 /DNA_ID=CAMNT_0042193505 /DNA_START=746 /DNA_END=1188 /DNA_ORIENTATION=-